jgi:hypothetical protein
LFVGNLPAGLAAIQENAPANFAVCELYAILSFRINALELDLPICFGPREVFQVLISCSFPINPAEVWFGPKAPAGMANNWVQSIPGKGWFMILRLHGPLEPWFNKNWRPGEIELQPRWIWNPIKRDSLPLRQVGGKAGW